MFDLVTLLRDAAYLAFEDGTNDYTTADKAANALEAQAARIAELEAALATAQRDAMEEAAKIAESEPELHDQMPAEFEKYSREILARASCIATKRAIAAAIRAALAGEKDE